MVLYIKMFDQPTFFILLIRSLFWQTIFPIYIWSSNINVFVFDFYSNNKLFSTQPCRKLQGWISLNSRTSVCPRIRVDAVNKRLDTILHPRGEIERENCRRTCGLFIRLWFYRKTTIVYIRPDNAVVFEWNVIFNILRINGVNIPETKTPTSLCKSI